MSGHSVIIGGGQAGAQAAFSLRQAGFDGAVTLISAEAAPPYQRPPLSKAYLKGELAEERLHLRPTALYEKQSIDLRLCEIAKKIDRSAKTILTQSDEIIRYDKLLIATGAPPRRLNATGADLKGVHYLRTLKDSDALRDILNTSGRILIVGAGYIGLEVAAVARAAGRSVTVLEMADRVLSRVASAPVSEFYQDLHRGHGVDIRLGAALDSFVGENGRLTGATLKSGEEIDCAAALVGIGAAPAVELAEAAGLVVENGIVVDDHARTSDPHIYAAGDCASFPSARYGRRIRLESVPNATDQAKVAALNMAGGNETYDPLPWFWSDQFDVKLQTVGLSDGYDALVVREDSTANSFAVWYLKNGAPLAVDAMNDPGSFAVGRRLILAGAQVDPSKLANPRVDLKSLV